MSDIEDLVEKAAEVLAANWKRMHTNESLGFQRMLAQALANAGLLPTETEWGVRTPEGDTDPSCGEADARGDAHDSGWQLVSRYVTPWKDAS